jgi:amidase
MKNLLLFSFLCAQSFVYAQSEVSISFQNDAPGTSHLSLIIFTPDGKGQTRVGDLKMDETKTYSWPEGTEVFVATLEQETYAMKGNDIKKSSAKPYLTLQATDNQRVIKLSELGARD